MADIDDILRVADAYAAPQGLATKTVSHRVFRDSKKLDALRNGATITLSRYNNALDWFSENWPDKASWPEDIIRPSSAPANQGSA